MLHSYLSCSRNLDRHLSWVLLHSVNSLCELAELTSKLSSKKALFILCVYLGCCPCGFIFHHHIGNTRLCFRFGRADCIMFCFRPEQFVRIGFAPANFALVSGQSFPSMLFVKGTRYHALVVLFLRFVVFCSNIAIAIVTTIAVLAPNNRLYHYQRNIPALARRKGKRPPIAEIDRSLFDRPALQRHGRGGRIHVETPSVQIPAPALDGIPADKSPRNFIGEEARGDSVSLAGQNPTVLLQCRSGGFGLVTGQRPPCHCCRLSVLVFEALAFPPGSEATRPATRAISCSFTNLVGIHRAVFCFRYR